MILPENKGSGGIRGGSEMLNRGQGAATALVDARGSVTYDEFRSAVAGFAANLHDRGLVKGDRVALWGYNSANWLVAFFAIVRAGGVALLLNYSMDIADAAELLRMIQGVGSGVSFGHWLFLQNEMVPAGLDEARLLYARELGRKRAAVDSQE